MLRERVITALVLLLVLGLALFVLPEILWTALVVLLVMQGISEWSRLSSLTKRQANWYWALSLILMGSLLALDSVLSQQHSLYLHLVVYFFSAVLWLMVVPTWMMIGLQPKHPILMTLTGWAVLIPTGFAMMDLHAMSPSPWILLMIMGLVWVADSAAYFAGRKFGKNKLAPKISPGKTWEGVIGALLGVSVYISLLWYFTPLLRQHEMLPFILLASWWWVGLAVIGDLFESAVKRQAGVKDSGALLPGHGGLLDRIDALTSTLPLAAMAILFQQLGA